MNRLQKIAWANLYGLGLMTVLSGMLIVFVLVNNGTAKISDYLPAIAGIWMLAVLFLLVGTEIWAKKKVGNKITFDERDLSIQIKALHAGMIGLLATFLWMSWLVVPSDGLFSTWGFTLMGSCAFVGALINSLAILYQYGWREKGDTK